MEIVNLAHKQQIFRTLNERQRRQYAGQLALDLGHGGIGAVSRGLGIHPMTIRAGIRELKSPVDLPIGRVRRTGGGRKKKY